MSHVFVVPGDYNLPLLDGLALTPGLTLVRRRRRGRPRAALAWRGASIGVCRQGEAGEAANGARKRGPGRSRPGP